MKVISLKNAVVALLFACVVTSCSTENDTYEPIVPPITNYKVACVGTSITYGARQFLADREKESYPGLLDSIMGVKFMVNNFGVSGSCVLKSGNAPYWNTETYTQLMASAPNVVLVEFGTNDSRDINWPQYGAQFEADLKLFVAQLQQVTSRPRVYLLTPPPAFSTLYGVSETVISNQIIPIVNKIGSDLKIKVIDIHSLLLDDGVLLPDGIHPNKQGNLKISDHIATLLKADFK